MNENERRDDYSRRMAGRGSAADHDDRPDIDVHGIDYDWRALADDAFAMLNKSAEANPTHRTLLLERADVEPWMARYRETRER